MQCPFCKEEIADGAIKCKHCGSMLANQPSAVSVNPAPLLYTDYSQVPWHRKNWFAILCVFIPFGIIALLFIVFTGDIYHLRKGQLRKYGKGAKVFLIIFGLISLLSVATNITGFIKGVTEKVIGDYNTAGAERKVSENFNIAVRYTQAELAARGINITMVTTDAVAVLNNNGSNKSPYNNKLDAFVSGTSVGHGQVAISARNIRSCAGCKITISADTNGDGMPDETVTLTDEYGSVEESHKVSSDVAASEDSFQTYLTIPATEKKGDYKDFEEHIKERNKVELKGVVEPRRDPAGPYYGLTIDKGQNYKLVYGFELHDNNLQSFLDELEDKKTKVTVKGTLQIWKDGSASFDNSEPIEIYK